MEKKEEVTRLIKISEGHMALVEYLQKKFKKHNSFKPTKKQVVENAIEYYKKRTVFASDV